MLMLTMVLHQGTHAPARRLAWRRVGARWERLPNCRHPCDVYVHVKSLASDKKDRFFSISFQCLIKKNEAFIYFFFFLKQNKVFEIESSLSSFSSWWELATQGQGFHSVQ